MAETETFQSTPWEPSSDLLTESEPAQALDENLHAALAHRVIQFLNKTYGLNLAEDISTEPSIVKEEFNVDKLNPGEFYASLNSNALKMSIFYSAPLSTALIDIYYGLIDNVFDLKPSKELTDFDKSALTYIGTGIQKTIDDYMNQPPVVAESEQLPAYLFPIYFRDLDKSFFIQIYIPVIQIERFENIPTTESSFSNRHIDANKTFLEANAYSLKKQVNLDYIVNLKAGDLIAIDPANVTLRIDKYDLFSGVLQADASQRSMRITENKIDVKEESWLR